MGCHSSTVVTPGTAEPGEVAYGESLHSIIYAWLDVGSASVSEARIGPDGDALWLLTRAGTRLEYCAHEENGARCQPVELRGKRRRVNMTFAPTKPAQGEVHVGEGDLSKSFTGGVWVTWAGRRGSARKQDLFYCAAPGRAPRCEPAVAAEAKVDPRGLSPPVTSSDQGGLVDVIWGPPTREKHMYARCTASPRAPVPACENAVLE